MPNPRFTIASMGARVTLAFALILLAGVGLARGESVDPPGFAPVTLKGTQIIRLNVVCFEHQVGDLPPSPCRGEFMFHDVNGRTVKGGSYELSPGQATFLQLAIPATNAAGEPVRKVTIIPCIFPGVGGPAIPSVEVIDRDAGRVVMFETPAAARMSRFNNAPEDPGDIGGFDPQPDPPGFAPVTLRSDQTARMNVFCFEHPINGYPPNPCNGAIMFHDAAGNVLRRGTYALEPGQTKSFEFVPPATRTGTPGGIIPCIIPERGGRAVPGLEVTDSGGNTVLVINPAVARMSDFQQRSADVPQ